MLYNNFIENNILLDIISNIIEKLEASLSKIFINCG